VVGVTEVGVDRGPVRVGLGLSTAATGTAILALAATGAPASVGLAAVGGAILLGAGFGDRQDLLDGGALALFLAVLFAGVSGGHPGPLLVAMVGTVVAWDAAEQALTVGEHLGQEAPSRRLVVVHVATTTLVGAGGAAVGYGVFKASGGGQPVSALMLLVLGGVLITWALRR
jgi:hypothetical protein